MRLRSMVLLGAAAAVGIGMVISQDALSHYEEPAYELLKKDGDFEIRKYPELISAEVLVPKSSSSENEAFRILAGYIFGKNRSREKISMTVPVTMEKVEKKDKPSTFGENSQSKSEKIAMTVPVIEERSDAGMRMRFFMPAKFRLDTLPVPVDERIKLNNVPAQSYAVVRFSGFLTKDSAKEHEARLRQFMHDNSYQAGGDAMTSAYNPPWTLPFLRRNEVWVPVNL